MRIFLTGGTGFLGSYVAERAIEGGHEVRALARPTSDTAFLRSLGADIVIGDLRDAASLRTGAEGCDRVIHAAAKVMDWGTWEEYYEETVEAARRMYDAAATAGVPRAVHISSVGVYGRDAGLYGDVDESMGPLPDHKLPPWFYYGRAKSLAESLAMEYHAKGKLQMSVIRPAWLFGARDRAVLPRLLVNLERGRIPIFGDGTNELSLTYAGNVADAVMLAATKDEALGEAFNVSNDHHVTQRQYMNALADALGYRHPSIRIPYRAAMALCATLEAVHRGLRLSRRPILTRQGVQLVALPSRFVTQKIREQLGWEPRVDFETAIGDIAAWWQAEGPRIKGQI